MDSNNNGDSKDNNMDSDNRSTFYASFYGMGNSS